MRHVLLGGVARLGDAASRGPLHAEAARFPGADRSGGRSPAEVAMMWLQRRWSGAASAGASGILFLLSLDMGPFGALALVAPVPLLLYALGAARTRSVAGWAFAAGLVARLNLVHAYFDVFPPVVLV